MKKLVSIIIMTLAVSGTALADGWRGHHGRGHGHGHHKHHHHHHGHYGYRYRQAPVYYRERVRYVPAPPVRYYDAYPAYPAPRYYRYDRRSTEGLVGGAVGSMIGYEVGRGDPLAAGVGAAFGSYLGNEIGR